MSELQVFDCEQGSPEWFQCRLGIATASEFHTVRAKGKVDGTSATSETRRKYMYRLAGERITNVPAATYESAQMVRGREMEAEARETYQFARDVELVRHGFIRRGIAGCSPDALIGDDGVLEIKTAEPHVLIELILSGGFPARHKAQCQGALWVTGRKWVDLIVYWPGMPLFIKRASRDVAYINELERDVRQFDAEVGDVVSRITGANVLPLQAALEASLEAP